MAKDITTQKLAMEPPEPGYVSERYVISIPATDKHLDNPWELRIYANKVINKKLGDEVQLTSLKVKRPGPLASSIAKLLRRTPKAKLYVTTKF